MNRKSKPSHRSFLTALACAASLALAGCGNSGPAEEPPLAGSSIGGDFTLTGSDGNPVGWSDFAGKYRVVYFGYAYCPDICPNDMNQIARGLKKLGANDPAKRAKIKPIFITIDPERDTPEVVGQFANAFSPDFTGLTGTPEQIADVAKKFAVYYGKEGDAGGDQYLMSHSNIVYLFGPDGQPLATLPADQGPDAVAAELEKWVS